MRIGAAGRWTTVWVNAIDREFIPALPADAPLRQKTYLVGLSILETFPLCISAGLPFSWTLYNFDTGEEWDTVSPVQNLLLSACRDPVDHLEARIDWNTWETPDTLLTHEQFYRKALAYPWLAQHELPDDLPGPMLQRLLRIPDFMILRGLGWKARADWVARGEVAIRQGLTALGFLVLDYWSEHLCEILPDSVEQWEAVCAAAEPCHTEALVAIAISFPIDTLLRSPCFRAAVERGLASSPQPRTVALAMAMGWIDQPPPSMQLSRGMPSALRAFLTDGLLNFDHRRTQMLSLLAFRRQHPEAMILASPDRPESAKFYAILCGVSSLDESDDPAMQLRTFMEVQPVDEDDIVCPITLEPIPRGALAMRPRNLASCRTHWLALSAFRGEESLLQLTERCCMCRSPLLSTSPRVEFVDDEIVQRPVSMEEID